MDLKRDKAVSMILAAVAGSPMCPSTKATWLDAATSVDCVTLRELATTLKPRSTSPLTIPAPIPCEAPVTMAVFCVVFMVVSPNSFVLRIWLQSELKSPSNTMRPLAHPIQPTPDRGHRQGAVSG